MKVTFFVSQASAIFCDGPLKCHKVAQLHWFSEQSCTQNWPFLRIHFHNFLFLLIFERIRASLQIPTQQYSL